MPVLVHQLVGVSVVSARVRTPVRPVSAVITIGFVAGLALDLIRQVAAIMKIMACFWLCEAPGGSHVTQVGYSG